MKIKDLLLIIISSLFTLAGIFIIWKGGSNESFKAGLGASVFFGFCLLIFIFNLKQKLDFKKKISSRANVSIQPNIRFYLSKLKAYSLGFGMIVLGSVLIYTAYGIKIILAACGAFLLFIGIILVIGYLTGLLGKNYISFEFEGLRMGYKKYSYLIRWDNILNLSNGIWNENPVLIINLINPEDLILNLETKEKKIEKIHKKIRKAIIFNISYHGCHLLLMPQTYGLDVAYTYSVIQKYLHNPETRSELKVQSILP